MSDKKTKIDCHLVTRGTNSATAKVTDDLTVSDPDSAVGEQIINEAIQKAAEDDESRNS